MTKPHKSASVNKSKTVTINEAVELFARSLLRMDDYKDIKIETMRKRVREKLRYAIEQRKVERHETSFSSGFKNVTVRAESLMRWARSKKGWPKLEFGLPPWSQRPAWAQIPISGEMKVNLNGIMPMASAAGIVGMPEDPVALREWCIELVSTHIQVKGELDHCRKQLAEATRQLKEIADKEAERAAKSVPLRYRKDTKRPPQDKKAEHDANSVPGRRGTS